MSTIRFVVLLSAVMAASTSVALANQITTLNASTDVWIRESDPTATNEDDGISIAAVNLTPSVDGNKRRYGLVEFELATGTKEIVAAHLELYAINYWANSTKVNQAAGLLVPDDITSTTWTNLWTTKTEVALQGLGYFNLAANSAQGTWYSSNEATASDLAALNAQRTGSRYVTMLLAASSGRHEWADNTGAFAPRLVLTTVPEPSTMAILGSALFGLLAYAWRKRK